MSLVLAQSCINDDFGTMADVTDADYITIDISQGALLQTRAAVADSDEERTVGHVDILIFDKDGSYKYSERIVVSASEGTVRLGKNRRDLFGRGAEYFVYVIANSTYGHEVFSALADVEALHALRQVDERVHITASPVDGAPERFLMDGVAYLQSVAEPSSPVPVVLYDGNDKESTKLKVRLRRAAAKVVIRLFKGDNVEFIDNKRSGYYFRNMPYSTSVIPLANQSDNPNADLRTPDKLATEWSSGVIEVSAYLYSHAWSGSESFTNGTSLIVNVPLRFEGKDYENSYYQIALRPSESLRFDRNHYYVVSGTINAPGAEEEDQPVSVDGLGYTVRDWDVVNVDVNGENAPVYLTVSHDTIRMHNKATDATTLQFSSSSDVTVSLISNKDNYPYFIDKYGQRQKYTGGGISAVAKGISGNITVNSPVPANNTIRYFMLEVSNREGLVDTVFIEQSPLIYITNIQGWYSYRKDFRINDTIPTTYEYKGDRIVGVSFASGWGSRNYDYDYSTSPKGFWRSKVVLDGPEDNGMSKICYYQWGNGSTPSTSSAESNSNARMYHIRVTSTSGKYKVGRPRLDENGYTDSKDDNAELVSPSFMIASRLGFVDIMSATTADTEEKRMKLYSHHCSNYVEVYKDEKGNKVELRDWRLPTAAELNIIMDLQGTGDDADAIDYLLNCEHYVSANGDVSNKNYSARNTVAGRCVRDAYEK